MGGVLYCGDVISSSSRQSAAIYRPPSSSSYGSATVQFCTELAAFLDELMALPGEPLICGDFNCVGATPVSIDTQLADVLESRKLEQLIEKPTYQGGNLLDLLISFD
jgi:hypothetical protein